MKTFIRIAAAIAVALLALPAQASENHAGSFAAAGRLSTMGFGLEGIYGVSKRVNVRAQANFISMDETLEEDGVNYDGKLDFQTFGVLADYHPFAGSFRLTGGLFQNGNEIGLRATCPSGCPIGNNTTITSTAGPNPGHLDGKVDFNSTAPYAGLGWGNAMNGGPFLFAFDIGVLFQGSPKVDLNASGMGTVDTGGGPGAPEDLGANATVQTEVQNEEKKAQDELDEFKLYPVISFTFGWRF